MGDADPDGLIVRRCLDGDVDAFGALVTRYQRQVFSAALHIVGNREDASEITQQVFLKAYQSLRSYDPARKFFSWIYRVAMNESINHVKARRDWQPLEENAPSQDLGPLGQIEKSERRRELERAVRSLGPEHRAAVVARHFLELSYSEAAGSLGIPEKTFKSRLFEARQLLRSRLEASGYAG